MKQVCRVMELTLDTTTLIRGFYLASALAILFVRLVPPLRNRFLNYGARATSQTAATKSNNAVSRLLDTIASFRVPHNYFTHFYILSLATTAFWIGQLTTIPTPYLSYLLRHTPIPPPSPHPVSPLKTGTALLLFTGHSIRRLSESFAVPDSSSTMFVGHYILGLLFYLVTPLALIIDTLPTLAPALTIDPWSLFTTLNHVPNLPEIVAVFTSLAMASQQHKQHTYLASLPKYTLPTEGAFRYLVAPHYRAECAIYLSLAVLSAPVGGFANWTVLCAFIFVCVNLTITADGTKKWMLEKFPEQRKEVVRRARMMPGVF